MSDNNNIQKFTAADIEKYHKGLLSAKEMHAMEKAAMDDPFLADALEGYAVAGVNVNADIAELKRRLAEKAEETKVIPIHGSSRSSFPWLRAAAVIIFLAGAGLLSYQFLFKTKNNDIAQAPQKENPEKANSETTIAQPKTNTVDNPSQVIQPGAGDTTTGNNKSSEPVTVEQNIAKGKTGVNSVPLPGRETEKSGETSPRKEETKTDPYGGIAATVEEKTDDELKKDLKNDNAYDKSAVIAKTKAEIENKDAQLKAKQTQADAEFFAQKRQQGVTANAKDITTANQNIQGYNNMNYFRGRVTDPQNNPLPFTNVINTADNVGTYTDAKGNFTLVSTDSTLNLQFRALGFENNRYLMRSDIPTNQIMMQEDRNLNARVLDTVKRNFAARSREGNMTFEEPEPADGWTSYGSYLANNLNVPESFDSKKNIDQNVVELSFEVNKFGDPVNIRVEKSLCDKCDKEAIRLVKEGPKWKRKAKKGKRTTVRVPFIKPSDW